MKPSYLIVILFLITVASCTTKVSGTQFETNQIQNAEGQKEAKQSEPDTEKITDDSAAQSKHFPTHPYPREPISADYYGNFINSTLTFSQVRFSYFMSADVEHPNERELFFNIQSQFTVNPETNLIISGNIAELQFYDCYYDNLDFSISYKCELSSSQVNNIFQIMQNQSAYYFNAEEYGGAESLDIAMEGAYGHINYVTFTIEEPELVPFTLSTVKTLCKGWEPGDDPPQELMPLINYLETVILPEMREHPYP